MKRAVVALLIMVTVLAVASVALAENGSIKPWTMAPTERGGSVTLQ